VIKYLSLSEVAALLGYSVNTMKAYQRDGRLPPPDASIGRTRGWHKETITKWQAGRPGRGARTDLADPDHDA
jgi:predicted DNA-binding transcriptional regulator AlpA